MVVFQSSMMSFVFYFYISRFYRPIDDLIWEMIPILRYINENAQLIGLLMTVKPASDG